MWRRLLCTLLALPAFTPVSAAPEPPPRPKLCLVLAGGGALGIAHIGVLEVLEELRVPIDCISGTSVGAVMGGLYAAGYSPAELTDLVARLDWPALMTDQADRPRRPFRAKLDDLTYLTRGELGLTSQGLTTPPGLVAGHRLGTELRLLALRVNGIQDFDQLPIPFRATATDIETGELVVLDHGELAAALRASMSVPGLLAPVEFEGRWLVDGASVANFPVAPAKALGAEVMIGVDLGQPLAARKRPRNLVEVLTRTLDFSTRLNAEQVLPEVAVLIRPAVAEFGMFDFQEIALLLERGREAARAQAESLRAYAVDDAAWQAYLRRRQVATAPIPIHQVSLESGQPRVAGALAAKLRTRPGAVLDPTALRQDLDQLWHLGDFATVDFTLTALPAGGWHLQLRGTPWPLGPSTLRFGVALTSDLEGDSRFEALASWRRARLNAFDGDLRVAVEVGEAPAARAEWYQPLAASRVPFLALGVAAGSTKLQLPVAGSPVQYRRFLTRAQLDLGLSFGPYGELRAGLRHDDTRERATSDAPPEAPEFDREDAGFRLALTLDQLDRVNFPSRGYFTAVEWYRAEPSLGADERYRRLDVTAVAAASHHRRHRWIGLLRGSTALGGALPTSERVQLGGLFNLSGSPPGEVNGNYGGVLTSIYLYQLGKQPTFVDGLYVGFSLEVGNAWETAAEVSGSDLRRSFALVFGADTLVGPIYLAHGQTTGGKDSFYLYLGRTF